MLKKTRLNILFILFASWSPLNERVHAECAPCTLEQKKSCTDVKINYEDPFKLPLEPEWTATMKYTPCGADSEASLDAKDWNKAYSCCVQSDTHVKMVESDLSQIVMDQIATKPELNIACMGYAHMDGAWASCCRDTSVPLPPCTKLTISYDPGLKWIASMQFTPCQKCAKPIEEREYLDDLTQTYDITPDTLVRIGPMWSLKSFINEKMSGPEVKVHCSGKWLGDSSCCVVGRPNCPPTTGTTKNSKAPQESPGETTPE